ncbi:hypothetical protein AGABI1DRAFT_131939 [Agaricus bisporus var. burnettii JB137-S8]|uniref:DUF6534 domain-containing protein n=1 Tax=Agaricus bisporus var. burnettii (strain JB137-S8 / ATCC MYA-4627 / FGSC 10392) TaxID=597362 RepID=K5WK88_AGABU|nr:uncharacterized protein AGABI1DRAFT_131939 [Agaricus bisporus var. burnettii JB137-S8]EKM75701.1 hypothetical protein AGABI1DRAFT_131939 [Agaricus bisporus var. burnettii JB137-S8]
MNPDPEVLNFIVTYRRGPMVGNLLNVFLYGILTVQTYLYYIAFPNDKKITKGIVAFVFTIDTAQTTLALYDFYQPFRVNGDHLIQDYTTHQWLTIPLSSTLIATVAQLFYARRIYTLSKNKIVTSIVIVLSLVQLVFGLVTAMLFLGIAEFLTATVVFYLGDYAWGPAGAVCDLVIAVYMTWFLTKQRKRSPSRKTQVMVTRIKRLVLETGLLTGEYSDTLSALVPCAQFNPAAVFAASYLLFLIFVGYNTLTIPGLTLGKIYSNSILVLLNNRCTIAGGRNEPAFEFEVDSYHLSDLPRREDAEHGIRE